MRLRHTLPLLTPLLLVPACGSPSDNAQAGPPVPFVERAREVGIDFVHFNGMSGELYFVEIFGPGAGLLDYDNDGDLDLYLPQGQLLGPDKTIEEATFAPPSPPPLSDRLYRNDLVETGYLHFADVTASSGIEATAYGMGVAAGDYDGDGWIDLYVTAFGPNQLWRNNGDGTFEDVTRASGTAEDRWSTSAAFVDYDLDGLLDLFVVNYVNFSFATHRPCVSATGAPGYCGPASYRPYPDRLLRNRGDGTFEDVSERSGIALQRGAGLGICYADLNRDGRLDIYVANDLMPNQLWINRGDGTMSDQALLSGCAFNVDGEAESSMGIDAADFDGDGDGDEDLFMAHLDGETNTLYRNDGSGWFVDFTFESALGVASRDYTGFGAAWIDYDNDGWLDLLVANGAIKALEALERAGDPFPLHQRNQLFHNLGQGSFAEVSARAGPAFELSEVSRGAAFGDVDNDGDTDVLITNNNGPARLLVNQVGARNHWLGLRLVDADTGSDVVGTLVELVLGDGRSLRRRVRVAASYLSSNDPRVLFGLGPDPAVRSVRAVWPDGTSEQWDAPRMDHYTTLLRGSGGAVE